jgi:hypothetical protein
MSAKQLCAIAVFSLTVFAASGQNFAINWFTIDGGGGDSGGGQYVLHGTIGQPDAGAMSGGIYFLAGGFWTGFESESSSPFLRIVHVGPNVVIAWPNPSTGFELQESSVLTTTATWSNVAQGPTIVGNEKQVTVSAVFGNRFYRLRKP